MLRYFVGRVPRFGAMTGATRLARGDVLFRAGDPVDCVFRLLTGEVEVVRDVGDGAIVLGKVLCGQFIGEMGVAAGRARRSATARAITAIEVERIAAPTFLDRICDEPEAARELIRRLSRRLHELEDRLVDEYRCVGTAPAKLAAPARLRLRIEPAGPALKRQLASPLQPAALPFVIGRRPAAGEALPPGHVDLGLVDSEPFRLSRLHFMLEQRDGDIFVHDLASTLGTIVNGTPIGRYFDTDEAKLRRGETNEVVAGGLGSPFVFAISVP